MVSLSLDHCQKIKGCLQRRVLISRLPFSSCGFQRQEADKIRPHSGRFTIQRSRSHSNMTFLAFLNGSSIFVHTLRLLHVFPFNTILTSSLFDLLKLSCSVERSEHEPVVIHLPVKFRRCDCDQINDSVFILIDSGG